MSTETQSSRRNFLKNASLATVGSLSLPALATTTFANETAAKKIALQDNDVILFQGDSITDSGRKKDDAAANSSSALGNGYAQIAAAELLFKYAGKNLKIYNRGISGNKVYQLAERWDKDCLELKPTVLSILIGVNDYWHKHNGKYDGTVKKYMDDYIALLNRTKAALPDVKLIIGEPYAVNRVKAVDDTWYPEFDEYRTVAKEIASQFNAVWIPYQAIYDKAAQKTSGVYWTGDGVHPSLAGAKLMAAAWMEAVK